MRAPTVGGPPPNGPEIFTIGHSTHELSELLALLRGAAAAQVADVRTVPRSRRVPQSASDLLGPLLEAAGIDYVHLKELGGWRRPLAGSPNRGWRNDAFQGYADYMATPEFEAALERLQAMARARPVALMCAEGLWWRCHRRLISDALAVRGWRVRHILPDGKLADHELTPFAVLEGTRITYPAEQTSLDV